MKCALQNQPNMFLIGEELEEVKGMAADKKNFGVVLIPEGLVYCSPELHSLLRVLGLVAGAPIGHGRSGMMATEVLSTGMNQGRFRVAWPHH